MSARLKNVTEMLLDNTVFERWFSPMQHALEKVRHSDKAYKSLPVSAFIMLGCLRQLMSIDTLREQIQHLFHLDETSCTPPVARSTWSDAMNSRKRLDILRQAMSHLIENDADRLADRYANIDALKDCEIYALDVTYQTESSHYYPIYPSDNGNDNQKGHLLLHIYDIRRAIPVDVCAGTQSIGEMRFLKECWETSLWTKRKRAIYVADRAFVDFRYWDERKTKHQARVISRMKSSYCYEVIENREVTASAENAGVQEDVVIRPRSSKQRWRMIRFKSPKGETYEYLSNDLTLEPGLIAFLYHRRWDEEKYFDAYKNDMASSKAWGKSVKSIEQQAVLGIVTYVLTRLFLADAGQSLGFDEDKQMQSYKHQKKAEQYCVNASINSYYVFYRETSKISRQVWRFLKNCFAKKATPRLFETQLRPLLAGYL